MIKAICHIELDIESGPKLISSINHPNFIFPQKVLQLSFLAQKQEPNQFFFHVFTLKNDFCLSTTVATPSENARGFKQSAVCIVFENGSLPNGFNIGSVVLQGVLNGEDINTYVEVLQLNMTYFTSKIVRFQNASNLSCLKEELTGPLYSTLVNLCEGKQVIVYEKQHETHFSSIMCYVAKEMLFKIVDVDTEPIFDPMADDFDSRLAEMQSGACIVGTNNEYVKKKLAKWVLIHNYPTEDVQQAITKIGSLITGIHLFKQGEVDMSKQHLQTCFGKKWKEWALKYIK
ncbi:Hypothetical_protein [Hexamita inflata]|uniref:Hypothetical_protein n=1 Tax=Hexamita inflata TaxID=28002 RepID=A0ABP1GHC2_9EUKA